MMTHVKTIFGVATFLLLAQPIQSIAREGDGEMGRFYHRERLAFHGLGFRAEILPGPFVSFQVVPRPGEQNKPKDAKPAEQTQ